MNADPSRRRAGTLSAIAPGLALLTFVCLLFGAGEGAAQDQPKLLGSPSEFSGMVEVPAGAFQMGLDEKWLKKAFLQDRRTIPPLLQGKKKDLWWGILLRETPEHSVETEAYAIDRYEVTNAQYLAFLEDACQKVVFTDHKMNNVFLVATSIYGANPTSWEMESIYWLNLKKLESIAAKILADNDALVRGALDLFNADLPEPAQKQNFADLPRTRQLDAWLRFKLPEGTALKIYTRLVPEHWPQAAPDPEELDHAVRFVSGVDADAFALWAGKHIPTEPEWEKAARGPKNTVYPWGEEWICDDKQQIDLLVWNGANSPPKAPNGDRPSAVDICPLGQSGYGCFNMLGNVMEWTSTPPLKYPRSDAMFSHWGQEGARVLRGQSYGGGKAFGSKELEIRATARIIEGPDGPVDARNLYSVLGFRCAKYHTPARDPLIHGLAFLRSSGLLPADLELDASEGYGIEATSYAAPGTEGQGKVFVTNNTRFVGVVPLRSMPYTTAKAALQAAQDGMTVILALVHWDAGIQVEVEVPYVPPPVDAPSGEQPPVDGAEDESEGGEEGEEGPAEEEKPKPKPGDKPKDKPKDKPRDRPKGKPKDKPGDKPKPAAAEEEGPPVPAAPKFTTELLSGTSLPNFIGIHQGRLAIFRPALKGIEFYGYVMPEVTPLPEPIVKSTASEFPRMAEFADGTVRLKIAVPTKARSSNDVFGADVELRVKGAPTAGWRGTKE